MAVLVAGANAAFFMSGVPHCKEEIMTELKNVTLTKAANVYLGGKVTSRKVTLSDGSVKTLGIMMPGEYTFGTDQKELMEILAGDIEILLPNEYCYHLQQLLLSHLYF